MDCEFITTHECGLVARSKREMYRFLGSDGNVYLPPAREANFNYIRDVVEGSKSYVRCYEVKVIRIPQIKTLRVQDLLTFARKHIKIDAYLPSYKLGKQPQREWVANIIHTLIPDKLRTFIQDKLKERKKSIISAKNMSVKALPQFVEAFKESNHLSYEKGRAHMLLRKSKKRTAYEVQLEYKDLVISTLDGQTKALKTTIGSLNDEIEDLAIKLAESQKGRNILDRLLARNIIDTEGNLIEME
uniref:Uncharacterized protein n=1 Tax=Euplotes harpa TaxID=151035 RepID=A0A7S3NG86_9SPIT